MLDQEQDGFVSEQHTVMVTVYVRVRQHHAVCPAQRLPCERALLTLCEDRLRGMRTSGSGNHCAIGVAMCTSKA
jgi:hypothetical protein